MSEQGDQALEQAKRSAEAADRALDDATGRASFASVVSGVADRQARLGALAGELARARSRGWAWGADWEQVLALLQGTAATALTSIRQESAAAANRVRSRLEACRAHLARTPVGPAERSTLASIEQEAEAARQAVFQEEQRLTALTKPFLDPFDRLEREVKEAHRDLDRFEQAKFQLLAGERPWRTAECTWQDAPGGTAVNGLLYLTDKRVRFEQKETVATKKFLFFTTASEERHATLLDEPIGNVAASDDATKGLVFKDQLVTLQWQNAKHRETTFDINSGETAKDWDTWIEELRAGRLAHRLSAAATAADPNEGLPVDAPTRCVACDATLDAVVRGMTVLTCRYCGQRHDLRFA